MGLAALQLDSITRSRTVIAAAPAKINLILDVVGRRPDGFHDIHSLAIAVDCCDSFSASWPNPSGLTLECSDPLLANPQNLAARAAIALARDRGIEPQAELRLQKNIPVGAGLGGGSSDAAAALRVCNELWNTGASDEELARIGAELGSDIPLFFNLPAAEISGRGERVAAFPLAWKGLVLIVYPGIHVRTADVYGDWCANDAALDARVSFTELKALRTAAEWNAHVRNELEPAVFRVCPEVKRAIKAVESLGLPPFRVTGSGSAFFRLYDCPDEARHAARVIQARYSNMTVALADGPVTTSPLKYKE